ncbi:MAG TPA: hypothetical protein PK854_03830 [Oscillospiraceae bacterium]|nr:hypothetical protein [Oscillospiraceae bacterium]HPS34376.1 hypothetical protein [Oscillospiraceae bacterium]
MMMITKIAPYEPFEQGAPRLNMPGVYGASPGKPVLFKIPAVGKTPLRFSCTPKLPDGLTLDTDIGILSGIVEIAGEYPIKIIVENALGRTEKPLLLRICKDGVCRTPLLGWTSWNAFRNRITQNDIAQTAKLLDETGLSAYGYQYVNIDSGWQGEYGGKHNAIQPNAKFPGMKALADEVHASGLKLGIYSTPMQRAWGGGEYPGCTRGKLDKTNMDAYYGIGCDHFEKNNVEQWAEWGIDYLKYDWTPCDIKNADLMKQCLLNSARDFAYCITVKAGIEDASYWSENCSSWRDNTDTDDRWESIIARFSNDFWAEHCNPGHFYDLDMLDTGVIDGHKNRLTPDEQLISFSIRAIFPSPIQLSCDLSKLTEFDLAMLCNDEILAINQDILGLGAVCIFEQRTRTMDRSEKENLKIYIKPLSDGTSAIGFFNLGETEAIMPLPVEKGAVIRDLWAKEDIIVREPTLILQPHTCRMLKAVNIIR